MGDRREEKLVIVFVCKAAHCAAYNVGEERIDAEFGARPVDGFAVDASLIAAANKQRWIQRECDPRADGGAAGV